MKVNIISGFLGSGKTTFIRRAVASLIQEKQEKVAVLVNEFGKIGIDGETIGREKVDVLELSQGCICCSLKAGLKDAVLKIAGQYQPQRLIIEPTGIALPSQIVETLQMPQLVDMVEVESLLHLVDASNFFECSAGLGDFYLKAIQTAQLVIINKTDLVSEQVVEGVEKVVMDLNPKGKIFRASYSMVSLEEVFSAQPMEVELQHQHVDNMSFESFATELGARFSRQSLLEFIAMLNEGKFGKVLRAKGMVSLSEEKSLQLDYVMGKKDVSEVDKGRSRIQVIGRELDIGRLEKFFES